VECALVSSGGIIHPVIGIGSFQSFGRVGPILTGAANILDISVQVMLEEVFGRLNLVKFPVADRIACLGKPFGTLPFKGDVKIVVPLVFHFHFSYEQSPRAKGQPV
jgi:hypothetical protein